MMRTPSLGIVFLCMLLTACGFTRSPEGAKHMSRRAALVFTEACLIGLPELSDVASSVKATIERRIDPNAAKAFLQGQSVSFSESNKVAVWYGEGWSCDVETVSINPALTANLIENALSNFASDSVQFKKTQPEREGVVASWSVSGTPKKDVIVEVAVVGKDKARFRSESTRIDLLWRD